MEEGVEERRNVGGAGRVVGTGARRYILEGEKEVETRIGNFICSNKYLPWKKKPIMNVIIKVTDDYCYMIIFN